MLTNVRRIHDLKGKKITLPEGHAKDASAVREIDIPMLLFSAKNDVVTTDQDARAIVAMKANRQLVTFDGDHLRGAVSLGFDEYFGKIATFLNAL